MNKQLLLTSCVTMALLTSCASNSTNAKVISAVGTVGKISVANKIAQTAKRVQSIATMTAQTAQLIQVVADRVVQTSQPQVIPPNYQVNSQLINSQLTNPQLQSNRLQNRQLANQQQATTYSQYRQPRQMANNGKNHQPNVQKIQQQATHNLKLAQQQAQIASYNLKLAQQQASKALQLSKPESQLQKVQRQVQTQAQAQAKPIQARQVTPTQSKQLSQFVPAVKKAPTAKPQQVNKAVSATVNKPQPAQIARKPLSQIGRPQRAKKVVLSATQIDPQKVQKNLVVAKKIQQQTQRNLQLARLQALKMAQVAKKQAVNKEIAESAKKNQQIKQQTLKIAQKQVAQTLTIAQQQALKAKKALILAQKAKSLKVAQQAEQEAKKALQVVQKAEQQARNIQKNVQDY